MGRRLRVLMGMTLALAALGATAQGAGAKPLLGIQGDGVISAGQSHAALDRTLAEAKAVNARIVRFEVSWAALEPKASGQRDASMVASIDSFVASAQKRGIKPLMFIDRTPCWASSAPASVRRGCTGDDANSFAVYRYAPADPAAAVPVEQFLAQRYGTKLAAFQLWNEPDQSNEKYWDGPDKVNTYVKFVKASYPAIKAVAPGLPVLAGSFVGTNGAWLKAMYAAGVKGSYDGLAVQFYDKPLAGLKATRALQRQNGDTKPLWLTEFGYTSCAAANGRPAFLADHPCMTKSVQATDVADVFAALARTSWIGAVVNYALRDENRAYQFGVMDLKGKKKPVYAKVKKALGGHAGTLRKPVAHLRIRNGKATISGSGPGIDTYTLRVKVGGQLRFRATFAMSRFNRFSIGIPASIGTSGLSATLTPRWTGKATRVRRG